MDGASVFLLFPTAVLAKREHTVTNMYGSHSTVTVCNSIPVTISVQTVTNMYGSHSTVTVCNSIPVTISVQTVTNMYGSHSTVTISNANPHCHYISAHCYQYVR